MTFHIVDLWPYYVCCTRSVVTQWTLCMVLYLSRMCRCESHAVLWLHIGILMRLLAAEPTGRQGIKFYSLSVLSTFSGQHSPTFVYSTSLHWLVVYGWGLWTDRVFSVSPGLAQRTPNNNNNNNNQYLRGIILVPPYTMVWTVGFQEQGQCLLIFRAARSLLASYWFPFLFFHFICPCGMGVRIQPTPALTRAVRGDYLIDMSYPLPPDHCIQGLLACNGAYEFG